MDLEEKETARLMGLVRAGFGALGFLAPRKAIKAFTGMEADDAAVVGMRGLASRDIALGIGLLVALDQGAPVRGWIEAGALADAGDALTALGSFKKFGLIRGTLFLGTAAGAAWLGMKLAAEID
jgi:hypothetical protein